MDCRKELIEAGSNFIPRSCKKCGFGPCVRGIISTVKVNEPKTVDLPVIYIDNAGRLVSIVSEEQVEAVLGPIVDRIRNKQQSNIDWSKFK